MQGRPLRLCVHDVHAVKAETLLGVPDDGVLQCLAVVPDVLLVGHSEGERPQGPEDLVHVAEVGIGFLDRASKLAETSDGGPANIEHDRLDRIAAESRAPCDAPSLRSRDRAVRGTGSPASRWRAAPAGQDPPSRRGAAPRRPRSGRWGRRHQAGCRAFCGATPEPFPARYENPPRWPTTRGCEASRPYPCRPRAGASRTRPRPRRPRCCLRRCARSRRGSWWLRTP